MEKLSRKRNSGEKRMASIGRSQFSSFHLFCKSLNGPTIRSILYHVRGFWSVYWVINISEWGAKRAFNLWLQYFSKARDNGGKRKIENLFSIISKPKSGNGTRSSFHCMHAVCPGVSYQIGANVALGICASKRKQIRKKRAYAICDRSKNILPSPPHLQSWWLDENTRTYMRQNSKALS